jgi:hypothetical protein
MARIRSLKPEIWLSPQVMNLSAHARLLFIGLITQADDYGRGIADPRRLKATIFPGDDPAVCNVPAWLEEVERQGLAVVYPDAQHGALYELTGWRANQQVSHAAPRSKYPAPNGNGADGPPHPPENSGTLRNTPEHSASAPESSSLIKDQGSRIKDLSILSGNTARARESPPSRKSFLKKIDRPRTRAGPGLQSIAPTLERFLVERTPEWAKGSA